MATSDARSAAGRGGGTDVRPGQCELVRYDGRADRSDALATAVPHPERTTVVEFSFVAGADDVRSAWHAGAGGTPTNHLVVDATPFDGGSASANDSFAVTQSQPHDLTGLGIIWRNALESVESHERLHLVFDSITAMLQYVDVEVAYKFLHVLTQQVTSSGHDATFFVVPDAHDERTVSRLLTLFDSVVDLEAA